MGNKLSIIAIGIAIVAVVSSIYGTTIGLRIGFVDSQRLVYEYDGTKEIQDEYNQESMLLRANLDSLNVEYQSALETFQSNESGWSSGVVSDERHKLIRLKEDLIRYEEYVQEHTGEREREMMTGVLNQINSFITEYGKQKGYDYILGTTSGGSILYGKPSNDITDDVLKELNQKYILGN